MIAATIITLLIMAFGGGGGDLLPEDFNKRVKAEITDKQVRKEVNALTKQINKDYAEYSEGVEALAKEELALNSNYDAGRREFEALIDRLMGTREDAQRKLLDNRFKMVNHMTQEQWDAVFADE